ncbi:MAG TPA: signal recognition particle-docking protein FtsY [Gammaproteobacteria bacterium]|nr:signal recognition particle-docking protein FtsY [Gammaproteobacteria bacterium]
MPPALFKKLRARLKAEPIVDADEHFDAETLETRLLMADVGVAATGDIVAAAEQAARGGGLVAGAVQKQIEKLLEPAGLPLQINPDAHPFVILITGVNGSGKTTTIAKLAYRLKAEGHSVMLAACDTFRAAAVEQIEHWGDRVGVPVFSRGSGADPASIAFDAWQAANTGGMDVLIVDTAGRLHTQDHLMAELGKIRRVLARHDPEAPHETLLVLDGHTGQNALMQAREFTRAIGTTGLVITKLDGSAKGGAVVAITRELGLPIRFVGLGESLDDLEPFDAAEFAAALVKGEA